MKHPSARRQTNPLEFFETPYSFVMALLAFVPDLLLGGRTIFEPAVGDGAIVQAIQTELARPVPEPVTVGTGMGASVHYDPRAFVDQRGPHTFITNDIDASRPADLHLDAMTPATWLAAERLTSSKGIEWTVTNPPFTRALPMLKEALHYSQKVAMHVRVTFTEPTYDRGVFLQQFEPNGLIFLPRHSFALNKDGKRGSDTTSTMWMVWDGSGRKWHRFVRRGEFVPPEVAA